MSAKATGLVWDLECPNKYGDLVFKPHHKYVLSAYADHADHWGKNIFPAIHSIAKKTGFDDRSVQRLTADLEEIGLLVEDGIGPKGTNRWKLPYSEGGDKLSPLTKCRGDKTERPLGDNSSGDNSSGDKMTPEVKEPEHLILNVSEDAQRIWSQLQEIVLSGMDKSIQRSVKHKFERVVGTSFENELLVLTCPTEDLRAWMDDRMTKTINRAFPDLRMEACVAFVLAE